jgi:Cytochrome c554 and c-prime
MVQNLCRAASGFFFMLLFGVIPVFAASPQPDPTLGIVVNGSVKSDYGPVADARVRIHGSKNFTLTDNHGRYTLSAPHRESSFIITAGKEDWFNNGYRFPAAPELDPIDLYPVPRMDDPNYRFYSPQVCAKCHNTLARYWDQSKMAHTTSNPKVIQMYNGSSMMGIDTNPGFQLDRPAEVGKCAVCHAPSASVNPLMSKNLNTILQTRQTEWDGVSCEYCHKIDKVIRDDKTPSRMKPLFRRSRPARGNSILVFGPYDDVVNQFMAASYASVQSKSVFCATCHGHFETTADKKPWKHDKVYTAAQWQDFGLSKDNDLPIQTTYQEWRMWQNGLPKDSGDRGKTCQSCHMSWRKDMLPYDYYIVDGQARSMAGVKRDPSTITPHLFEGSTEIQLKTALSLDIKGETKGKVLDVKVRVTNIGAGHWVPTGETMRSIMLIVKATDSKGVALKMLDGPRLPDWTGKGSVDKGDYAGLPGTVFARVLHDDLNNLNVPFWKATGIDSDTRIPPKTTVTEEFHFALVDPNDEPAVEAHLIYRPTFKAWALAKGWRNRDIEMTSASW